MDISFGGHIQPIAHSDRKKQSAGGWTEEEKVLTILHDEETLPGVPLRSGKRYIHSFACPSIGEYLLSAYCVLGLA